MQKSLDTRSNIRGIECHVILHHPVYHYIWLVLYEHTQACTCNGEHIWQAHSGQRALLAKIFIPQKNFLFLRSQIYAINSSRGPKLGCDSRLVTSQSCERVADKLVAAMLGAQCKITSSYSMTLTYVTTLVHCRTLLVCYLFSRGEHIFSTVLLTQFTWSKLPKGKTSVSATYTTCQRKANTWPLLLTFLSAVTRL